MSTQLCRRRTGTKFSHCCSLGRHPNIDRVTRKSNSISSLVPEIPYESSARSSRNIVFWLASEYGSASLMRQSQRMQVQAKLSLLCIAPPLCLTYPLAIFNENVHVRTNIPHSYPMHPSLDSSITTVPSSFGARAYKFGGRRSTGCHACRVRKIKVGHTRTDIIMFAFPSTLRLAADRYVECDETRPACDRCRRAQETCKYRDILDSVFLDETAHVSQRAAALWQSRSFKRAHGIACRNPGRILPLDPDSKCSLLYEVTLQRLFFDFVFQSNPLKGRVAHLDFLPNLCVDLKSRPCLESAVRATALANFARRCNSAFAAEEAFKWYGKAVQIIDSALSDPNLVLKDDTLLACHLLAICEVLYPTPSTSKVDRV